jgi:hypothetical protein
LQVFPFGGDCTPAGETPAARNCVGEGWSKKEVLGHLIDSASNNHQRFVRVQMNQPLKFPGYTQDVWVNVQAYQNASWKNLVELWRSFNTHLLHVIANVPDDKLNNICSIADKEPVTLKWLFEDYVRHAEHHLQQILGERALSAR